MKIAEMLTKCRQVKNVGGETTPTPTSRRLYAGASMEYDQLLDSLFSIKDYLPGY